MRKIENYVDYIFSDYPENDEILEIKKELKYNLEQRVNDYISEGLSEANAIERTIDSIGDIDELLNSFGINTNVGQYKSEIDQYCDMLVEYDSEYKINKPKNALRVSAGVFIILITLGLCGFLSGGTRENIIPVVFSLGIIIAIPLFIYTGFNISKYDLDNIPFNDEEIKILERDKQVLNLKRQLKSSYEIDVNKYNTLMIMGICLCIAAVFMSGIFSQVIDTQDKYVPIIFFGILGIGVPLIIYTGMMKSYSLVTQSLEVERTEEKAGAIIMPIATIIFLILGFGFNMWHPGWIVFPIGGILTGIIASVSKNK